MNITIYHAPIHIDHALNHIYHIPNQRKSQGISMGVFLCLLLSSGRVFTPTSRHNFYNFPPILEELGKH